MMTVAHIMVRIKGKNTIEMLKALTELETIQVGMSRSSLLKKNSNGFRNSENVGKINGSVSMGLSAFIEKKEYCSTCKHHMILTKNWEKRCCRSSTHLQISERIINLS